jgi:hypothetical protein
MRSANQVTTAVTNLRTEEAMPTENALRNGRSKPPRPSQSSSRPRLRWLGRRAGGARLTLKVVGRHGSGPQLERVDPVVAALMFGSSTILAYRCGHSGFPNKRKMQQTIDIRSSAVIKFANVSPSRMTLPYALRSIRQSLISSFQSVELATGCWLLAFPS